MVWPLQSARDFLEFSAILSSCASIARLQKDARSRAVATAGIFTAKAAYLCDGARALNVQILIAHLQLAPACWGTLLGYDTIDIPVCAGGANAAVDDHGAEPVERSIR
jgi:hypothetical protein